MQSASAPYGAPRQARGRLTRGRPAAPPRPGLVKAALTVAGIGLGVTTALAVTTETAGQFRAPGGLATFIGSLTGMAGT
jgi:hypothetical protein